MLSGVDLAGRLSLADRKDPTEGGFKEEEPGTTGEGAAEKTPNEDEGPSPADW